jgi:hypothetical protein
MKVSSIPRAPNRPQIRRMSQRELHDTQSGTDVDNPSTAV